MELGDRPPLVDLDLEDSGTPVQHTLEGGGWGNDSDAPGDTHPGLNADTLAATRTSLQPLFVNHRVQRFWSVQSNQTAL